MAQANKSNSSLGKFLTDWQRFILENKGSGNGLKEMTEAFRQKDNLPPNKPKDEGKGKELKELVVEHIKEIVDDQLEEIVHDQMQWTLDKALIDIIGEQFEESRQKLEARVERLEKALGQVARTLSSSDSTQ